MQRVKGSERSRPEGKCDMVRRRHPVTRLVAESPRGWSVRGGFRLWGETKPPAYETLGTGGLAREKQGARVLKLTSQQLRRKGDLTVIIPPVWFGVLLN